MTSSQYVTEAPADTSAAIRQAKLDLRRRIGDYAGAFAEAEAAMERAVADVVATKQRGEEVWPIVQHSDIAAGTVPAETREAIRQRGCAVVRGTFPRERAEGWDAELVNYLQRNDFAGHYKPLDDGAFAGLDAGMPAIYPIYWSKPQMEAREDSRMVATRTFLNSFWRHESEGRTWFDPTRDTAYPDRIRRAPEGKTTKGLSPHTDSGSLERWLLPAYRDVYRHVFDGHPAKYDAWDSAYRPEVNEYPSLVSTSAFRTFQGWTALSTMRRTEGVLNVVPIPHAMAYLLLRALQDDIPDDDLCGAANGQSLPVSKDYHAVLLPALSAIPDVVPGDTVWWHCDMIHAVDPVKDQKGWGNVMYIPVSPLCPKNAEYALRCWQAFVEGRTPDDFAPENYEVGWHGRPTADELSQTGRSQFGVGSPT